MYTPHGSSRPRILAAAALTLFLAGAAGAVAKPPAPLPEGEPKALPTPKPSSSPIAGGPRSTGDAPPALTPTPLPTTKPPLPPVYVVRFPLTATRTDDLGEGTGGRMQTDVTIDASGNLQATTRTHEMTVLHGFTGGVFVSLGDENHVIWNSQVQTFGVDGTGSGVIGGLLGSKSDRTDSWSDRVPLETLAKVRSIRIFHRPMPKEPIQLGAFANAISPLAGTVAKGAFITASESLSVDVVPSLERALGADARWATRQVDMRCASGDAVVGLLYEGSYSALLGAVLSPLVKFQYAAAGPMLANAKAFVCMSAARRAGFPPASS